MKLLDVSVVVLTLLPPAVYGKNLRQLQDPSPRKMNNMDFAGRGYDVVTANPRCSDVAGTCPGGMDPGWYKKSPVLSFTYTPDASGTMRTTADGRFLMPDGFNLNREVACNLCSEASETFDSQSYQESLSVDVDIDTSFSAWAAEVAFSASVDYNSVKKNSGSSKSVYYSTVSACSIYEIDAQAYTLLPLSQQFKNGVASLTAAYDTKKYLEFANHFGTHYTSNVLMGAKYTRTYQMSSSDAQSLTSMGVDVKAAVQVKAVLTSVKSDTHVKYDTENQSKFNQYKTSLIESLVGTVKPMGLTCADANECDLSTVDLGPWQAELLDPNTDLAPIKYSITPLDTLLTVDYFPNDKDIEAKRENLFKFYSQEYCNNVKLPYQCAPPNPEGFWETLKRPSIGSDDKTTYSTSYGGLVTSSSAIYLIGGATAFGTTSGSCIMYDPKNITTWTQLPKLPKSLNIPRSHLTVVAQQKEGYIYAIGGFDKDSQVSDVVEELDLFSKRWATKQALSSPRYDLTSVALDDGTIVVAGGFDTANDVVSTVEQYDSDNNKWSPLPSLVKARAGHCMGVIKGKVYVVGGTDGINYFADMEVLDVSSPTNTWSASLAPMPHARSYSSCAVVDDVLVVYGGSNAAGPTNIVEAYDPRSNQWIKRTVGLSRLVGGAAVAMYDPSNKATKMFVVGGITDSEENTPNLDFWSFYPEADFSLTPTAKPTVVLDDEVSTTNVQ
jgi:N-acetylneuraminic acid mutarotase